VKERDYFRKKMLFQRKKIFVVSFVLLVGLFGLRQASAQSVSPGITTTVIPSFTCLGSCPTLPVSPTVAELVPESPIPTEILPTLVPSITPGILEPLPSTGRHPDRGEDSGLVNRLLKIIERLIGKIPNPPEGGTPLPTQQACTDEAKICSDGSSVGRTGPNCSFPACPRVTSVPSTTGNPSPSTTTTQVPSPSAVVSPIEEVTPSTTPKKPKKVKKSKKSKEPKGLFKRILELLKQIFDMFRQLLGGGTPPGGGTPNPTIAISPTVEVVPTAEPTVAPTTPPVPTETLVPTVAITETPGTTIQPTTMPSETPSTTPAPTDNPLQNLLNLLVEFLNRLIAILKSLAGQ
jgi:hypothetical protein